MLYANTKFNTIKILIFKALSDSSTNHDKFVSVNDELRKYNEIKKKQWKPIVPFVRKILRTWTLVLEKLDKIN